MTRRGPEVLFSQLQPILNNAGHHGVDVAGILSVYGFDAPPDAIPPDQPLPLITYFRIERDIARLLDDLTARMSERKLTYKTGQFFLSQLSRANTLRAALEHISEYFNMMHGDTYNMVRQRQNTLEFVIDDRAFPYRFRHDPKAVLFTGEIVLIQIHCLLCSLFEDVAREALTKVSVVRAAADADTGHLAYWSAPVKFGAGTYKMAFRLAQAEQSVDIAPEAELTTKGIFARVIDQLAKHEGRNRDATQCSTRARDLILGGIEKQDKVALELGMSTATLRRRLAEERTSFRELVLETRLSHGSALLAGGLSVEQVADELGYSDIRAFNRAFKKWNGCTPAAFSSGSRRQTAS